VKQQELVSLLRLIGQDPSRLVFEDELTGVHNRRFLQSYLEHKVRWSSEEDLPLSLLYIDLDSFKLVNDALGHQAGDQVLTWLAAVLKEVAGNAGIPVRYGGDEFVLLLPQTSAIDARQTAEGLLTRTRERPFRLRETGEALHITLSVGVATAPDDARESRELIAKADTALYQAKRLGRNRVASAHEVDPAQVLGKTTLQRIEAPGLAGREDVLTAVNQAVAALLRGESRFMLIEGAPGLGKTACLEVVHNSLAQNSSLRVATIGGVLQEGYRPYYLATLLLVALLQQRGAAGEAILKDLSHSDSQSLSLLLPQVQPKGLPGMDQLDSAGRAQIFATLLKLIRQLSDPLPLALLVDDLDFGDEASLHLLRMLLGQREVPLLVIGSVTHALGWKAEEEPSPLERFCESHPELGVSRIRLTPLSAVDIAAHLRALFPGLTLPSGVEEEIVRITQGSPLFIGEIVRKLVLDQKVSPSSHGWLVGPLEEGYLPSSLEQIVHGKIAALNEEERRILAHAATLGETFTASYLGGAAQVEDGPLFAFLDRAESLGFVHMDFQISDEMLRFLGKRVLDISYGQIESSAREELHESVGEYQERLFRERLLVSASVLAYHFKRSANHEKAARYEQLQRVYDHSVFDTSEAESYAATAAEEEPPAEPRLDPASIRLLPGVLRALLAAVRAVQFYPPTSSSTVRAQAQLHEAVRQVLDRNEHFRLSQADRILLVNGQRLDLGEHRALAASFVDLLLRAELLAIGFRRGVEEGETSALAVVLAQNRLDSSARAPGGETPPRSSMPHVDLAKMRYSQVHRAKPSAAASLPTPTGLPLSSEDLAELPRLLRALVGATKSARLYPLGSDRGRQAVQSLGDALLPLMARHAVLNLAPIRHALLVNGSRVGSGDSDHLAEQACELLEAAGLHSLTFWPQVTPGELTTVVATLARSPDPSSPVDWDALVREHGLRGVAFNQVHYGVDALTQLVSSSSAQPEATLDASARAAARASPSVEDRPDITPPTSPEDLSRLCEQLLVSGDTTRLWHVFRRLFEDFAAKKVEERERTVAMCHSALGLLNPAHQHRFAELGVDPLLGVLVNEREPRVLAELSHALHALASTAVHFSDHELAERILEALRTHQRGLRSAGSSQINTAADLLDQDLDLAAQRILIDDLRSGNAGRQEKAAGVLSQAGLAAAGPLLDVIKQEPDYRTRRLAASVLARAGPEAARRLKRELALEVSAEQRFRLLEVADTVSRDLLDEIALCLGDPRPKVRRAAFQLAERLNDPAFVEVLALTARGPDSALARGAIRCIGRIGTATAVRAIEALLRSTRTTPEMALACSQALGGIERDAAVPALARVLRERHLLGFGRRWPDQVRATAALALYHIDHPAAARNLMRFTRDRDSRIRRLAVALRSGVRGPRPDLGIPGRAVDPPPPQPEDKVNPLAPEELADE
jgi:diguanylate cyclase (GGDEF)-like protein